MKIRKKPTSRELLLEFSRLNKIPRKRVEQFLAKRTADYRKAWRNSPAGKGWLRRSSVERRKYAHRYYLNITKKKRARS